MTMGARALKITVSYRLVFNGGIIAPLLLVLAGCFNNPSQSNTLRVSDKLRVYQDGDSITYQVTGKISYPVLDGSNKPVVTLENNCVSEFSAIGDPCVLSKTLESIDNNNNVIPATLQVTWNNYGATLQSGVNGAPSVNNVITETWVLTPSNPDIGGTLKTTRYITQVPSGDISGQVVLHAFSTPGEAADAADTAYFINRDGQSLSTVSNALFDYSPLVLNETNDSQFNLLMNCTSNGCEHLATSYVTITVGNTATKVYSGFRQDPTEYVEISKYFDNQLPGVTVIGDLVTAMPVDTSHNLGVNPFTQCNTLKLMTGANPLPQVDAYNTGSINLMPQLGPLEISNTCHNVQVITYPSDLMEILSAIGSYDPEGNPLTYSWTVQSKNASDHEVIGSTSRVGGIFAYAEDEFTVTVSASDGVFTARDKMYLKAFNSDSGYLNLPYATAGQNLYSGPNIPVYLDARSSTSTGNNVGTDNQLTYLWQVISAPVGSSYNIDNNSADLTTFTANITGEYQIDLTVTNIYNLTSKDSVFVYIETPGSTNKYPVVSANSPRHYYRVNGKNVKQLSNSILTMNAVISNTNIVIEGANP